MRSEDEDDQRDPLSPAYRIDLENSFGADLGHRVLLSRAEDAPSRATAESLDGVLKSRAVTSGLTFLTPSTSERLGLLRRVSFFCMSLSLLAPACGFPSRSSWSNTASVVVL